MSSLFVLLLLLSLSSLILGLIKPKLITKVMKKALSHKKIALIFGGLTLLFFILTGVTAPSTKVVSDQIKKEGQSQLANSTNPQGSPSPISTRTPATTPTSTPTRSEETVKVVYVIDGDTIEIEGGKRVRYIGIDTPETVDPRKPVQCFGKEASDKNKELVSGKGVRLEKDVSETDKYGRLLRYVYIENTFVNDYLVRQGYAYASSYPPDVKYQNQFTQAQTEAKSSKKGLWADNACGENSTKSTYPTPATAIQPKITNTSGSCKYSCSSPDRDCSDFSTHAEAQFFFNCCGFTATYDPMRLDNVGVGNGIACESLP